MYPHKCLVAKDLNHDLIIGRDFMKKYNVVLNFQNSTCTIGSDTIGLSRQSDVRSVIRNIADITIPPRTLLTVYGKYHHHAPVGEVGKFVQWE